MDSDKVVVFPGIFPATSMVAPNSPIALANDRRNPAMIPREANGIVTVKTTRQNEAPSGSAICSSRGLTASKPTRAERTSNGKLIAAVASRTARHVNAISMPNVDHTNDPIGPRRPNKSSRINPVATGGITIGNETIVSMNGFSRDLDFASHQANAMPGGNIISELPKQTCNVKTIISHWSDIMAEQ